MPTENKKFKKDLESGFGALERITFMSDLLSKQNEIRNTLDTRASIVIGFESAVVVVFFTVLMESIGLTFPSLLGLFTVIASLVLAIIALKPPHMNSKKGQSESIFYHHYINSLTLPDYQKEVHRTLNDEESIYNAYILEVYNLTRFSNIPRKFYLYLSIRVLIYGLIIAILFYALQMFLNS